MVKEYGRKALSYGMVVLVAFLMALNYQLFVFPNRFAPAGINGIFTMLQHSFGFKLSYSSIIVNIPLAIVSFFLDSRPRALRSLTYCLTYSAFLLILDNVDLSAFVYSTNVSALLGPAVAGIITGYLGSWMLRVNACYGGTEFVASLIHKYKPNFNFFSVIFFINISVAVCSYFVYDYQVEPVLLCIIYSLGSSSVRDNYTRKNRSAVRCDIITDNPHDLGEALLKELRHGVTMIKAEGVYSGDDKAVLVCIVNHTQEQALAKLVKSFPNSFVIFSPVTQVVGNFKRLDSNGKIPTELLDSGKKKASAAKKPAGK